MVAGIHVKSGSQLSVTPVLGHLVPSALHLDLHSYGAYACIQVNTVTHKNFWFYILKNDPCLENKKKVAKRS